MRHARIRPVEMATIFPAGPAPDTPARAALSALIEAHRFDRPVGSLMKLQGEETTAVYIVLEGWLLASKSLADGQRQIIDAVLPGGILEPASADTDISDIEVEALTDVVIAVIPRDDWRRACDEHAELAELVDLTKRATMSRMAERMLRLGKGTAENTVTYALCEMCLRSNEHGLVRNESFHIPMTQQQLGDFCGLSAVHICRTLRRLERHEVLTVTDHMDVKVHDTQKLAEMAEIDIEALKKALLLA